MSCQQIPTAWLWLCVLNLLHFTNTPSLSYPAVDRVVKSIPVLSCITSVDRTTSSSSRRYRYTAVQHIRGYLHLPSIVSFGYGPPDVSTTNLSQQKQSGTLHLPCIVTPPRLSAHTATLNIYTAVLCILSTDDVPTQHSQNALQLFLVALQQRLHTSSTATHSLVVTQFTTSHPLGTAPSSPNYRIHLPYSSSVQPIPVPSNPC